MESALRSESQQSSSSPATDRFTPLPRAGIKMAMDFPFCRRSSLARGQGPASVAGGVPCWGAPPHGVRSHHVAPPAAGAGDGSVAAETARTICPNAHRTALTYTALCPVRCWRLNPATPLRISCTNRPESPTNLHYHGSAYSPSGNHADNVSDVAPGPARPTTSASRRPPRRTFYNHPHRHGTVATGVRCLGCLIVRVP